MLKKLMAGEFSLSDTFWKFGVLGLVIVVFVVRFLAACWRKNLRELACGFILRDIFIP